MVPVEETKKRKLPVIKIDNSLKKYKDTALFEDKTQKANETLKKVDLPNLA